MKKTLELAEQIAGFPQSCLRHDRNCALHSAFSHVGMERSLEHEFQEGLKVISEAVQGARRFSAGEGRSGSFDTRSP